ncbi:hypothetical protein [Microbacterium sp. NPDC076895]|uniref:hypothetical protein n=1 Tax=Microbacterium sp. NPDC076895 TaxID=3154957 RepID=UPI003417138F
MSNSREDARIRAFVEAAENVSPRYGDYGHIESQADIAGHELLVEAGFKPSEALAIQHMVLNQFVSEYMRRLFKGGTPDPLDMMYAFDLALMHLGLGPLYRPESEYGDEKLKVADEAIAPVDILLGYCMLLTHSANQGISMERLLDIAKVVRRELDATTAS